MLSAELEEIMQELLQVGAVEYFIREDGERVWCLTEVGAEQARQMQGREHAKAGDVMEIVE